MPRLIYSDPLWSRLKAWRNEGCRVSLGFTRDWVSDGNGRDIETCVTNVADYLDISGDMLSYMPAGKRQNMSPTGSWLIPGRQKGKPGKVARSLFTQEFLATLNDKDFESFSNRIKAVSLEQAGEFRIVKGDEIARWYNYVSVAPWCGSLDKSCMRYDECADWFGIYTQNPDQVSLLIMVNPNEKLIGRALLWWTDQHGQVMDRIYGTDAMVEAFRAYAREHGLLYRTYGGTEEPMAFSRGEREHHLSLCVTLPNSKHEHYPYCDTFRFLCETGRLHNDKNKPFDYTLRDTHGGPRPRQPCHRCGVLVDPNNAYQDDDQTRVCEMCFYATHCVYCHSTCTPSEHKACGRCTTARTCQSCHQFAPGGLYDGRWCQACVQSRTCSDCGVRNDDVVGNRCVRCTQMRERTRGRDARPTAPGGRQTAAARALSRNDRVLQMRRQNPTRTLYDCMERVDAEIAGERTARITPSAERERRVSDLLDNDPLLTINEAYDVVNQQMHDERSAPQPVRTEPTIPRGQTGPSTRNPFEIPYMWTTSWATGEFTVRAVAATQDTVLEELDFTLPGERIHLGRLADVETVDDLEIDDEDNPF